MGIAHSTLDSLIADGGDGFDITVSLKSSFNVPPAHIDFEIVVTAQQVRSYKPAHGHFHRAAELIGDRRWLHVAQSYFHDIEPAFELGIPSVWVNRKAEAATGEAKPDWEVSGLLDLVETL